MKSFLLFLYKQTFYPPFIYWRRLVTGVREGLKIRWWLMQQDFNDCKISRRVGIKGRKDFPRFITIKPHAVIERDLFLWIANEQGANPFFSVAENVFISCGVYIGVYQPVSIGRDTIIGAYTYIISANHQAKDISLPIRKQGYIGAPVAIGSNVWIGCHVVILPGVTIGDGAIVAAGAVVNCDVGTNEVWGGVPAKKIKDR